MRISKDGEERKQELIDAALELFAENGYDNTSVNAIIQKVGVSKGAFYYYFKSKEDVLDCIVEQELGNVIKMFGRIADDETMNALEKINKFSRDAQDFRIKRTKRQILIYKVLLKDKSKIFETKMYEDTAKVVKPIYKKVTEQGIKEGLFDTEFPDQIGEFIISSRGFLSNNLGKFYIQDDISEEDIREIKRKISFFQDAFERVLGAEKGSIKVAEPLLELLTHLYSKNIGETEKDS